MSTADNICNEVCKHPKAANTMSPPIAMTSSFFFDSFDDYATASDDELRHYVYTRGRNPTTDMLEDRLARLEGAERCKVFASGMGAIAATLFTLLKAGDHVLFVNTVYGETIALAASLEKYGVTHSVINSTETDRIVAAIRDDTRVVYLESPSSQKFELVDLEAVADVARSRGVMTVIDNTWSTPLFQNPISHGIDVVIHACSKYIGGHSDIVCGAVMGTAEVVERIEHEGFLLLGASASPANSYLALRGLRTLPVRMRALDASVRCVLDVLSDDPRVSRLYHPYCGDADQRRLADRYLSGYGSLFGMDLADADLGKLRCFVEALKVFTLGVSWGGFESLVLPVYKGGNEESVLKRGLALTHVRIYVGLEDTDTLIADLEQALDVAYGPRI